MEEIEELIIEPDRPEHIAKHKVRISEVVEIVSGDYIYIKGKLERLLLIGKTRKSRFLTIIVGKRKKKGVYGLVTARPTSRKEKAFYKELVEQTGGIENGKN